jgi:hypothetical protein
VPTQRGLVPSGANHSRQGLLEYTPSSAPILAKKHGLPYIDGAQLERVCTDDGGTIPTKYSECARVVRKMKAETLAAHQPIVHMIECNGVVNHARLGFPDGQMRCAVPGNRQPYMDIATETLLCTEYVTTYVYS